MALFKKSKLEQLEASNAPDPHRRSVLIVDDEEANLRVMSAILSPHYKVLLARDGQDALDMIVAMPNRDSLACIISDQRMPRMTGVELFQHASQHLPRTIRIIVTGFIDLDAIVDSINKAEIYKFIIKPFDTTDFVLTIQRAVETFEMRQQLHEFYQGLEEKVRQRTQELAEKNEELQQAYRALTEVSLTDPLTGLRNRRHLMERIEGDVAHTLRQYDESGRLHFGCHPQESDLLFFLVDIDHFKQVNDQYGHAAGDAVLVQMRERLQRVFRESDWLIRWGGEEFLAVARSSERGRAEAIAERVRLAVANQPFTLPDGTLLGKTCSVGFACFPFLQSAPRALSWAQVVELADQALYMAKAGGRNAWFGMMGKGESRTDGLFQRLQQDALQSERDGSLHLVRSKGV